MADLLWPGDHRAGDHLSDAAVVRAALQVESAWLAALVAAGVAPAEAAVDLVRVVGPVDLDALATAAESGGNLVIPLLAVVRERLAGRHPDAARWLHRGLTSQDVLDTALVLALRDAVGRRARRPGRAGAVAGRPRRPAPGGPDGRSHADPARRPDHLRPQGRPVAARRARRPRRPARRPRPAAGPGRGCRRHPGRAGRAAAPLREHDRRGRTGPGPRRPARPPPLPSVAHQSRAPHPHRRRTGPRERRLGPDRRRRAPARPARDRRAGRARRGRTRWVVDDAAEGQPRPVGPRPSRRARRTGAGRPAARRRGVVRRRAPRRCLARRVVRAGPARSPLGHGGVPVRRAAGRSARRHRPDGPTRAGIRVRVARRAAQRRRRWSTAPSPTSTRRTTSAAPRRSSTSCSPRARAARAGGRP